MGILQLVQWFLTDLGNVAGDVNVPIDVGVVAEIKMGGGGGTSQVE